jgi:hypothetical protein
MEKEKIIKKRIVSNCCGSAIQFVKNFLGMKDVYFCNKCNKPCKPVVKNG